MYCEDSVGDEVEHHRPKNLYPDHTFLWDNYLYACGPCNGPKNNRFAVFDVRRLYLVGSHASARSAGDPSAGGAIGVAESARREPAGLRSISTSPEILSCSRRVERRSRLSGEGVTTPSICCD